MAFITKIKTTTGAPSLSSLSDGEMCLVVPDSALYQRVDASTLIQINGLPDLMPYCVTGALTDITGTVATMALATEIVTHANYSLASNEVTVSAAGVYQFSWSIVVKEDGTAGGIRGFIEAYLEKNTVKITQSESRVYTREASGGTGLSCSCNVTLAVDDVIRLRCLSNGTADPDSSLEIAQLSITKVG